MLLFKGFKNIEAPEVKQAFSLLDLVSKATALILFRCNILIIWIPNPPPAPITPTLSKELIRAFFITFSGVAIASQITAVSKGSSL